MVGPLKTVSGKSLQVQEDLDEDADIEYRVNNTIEEELDYQRKKDDLERQLQGIRVEYLQARKKIEKMDEKLREKFSNEIASLELLEQELSEIIAEHYAKNENNSEHQNSEWQQRDESDQQPNWDKEKVKRERKEKSHKIKKLFKKIANRTHPDKTKDPVLNELFLEARICYNSNDEKGLEEIWYCVQHRRSRILSKLIERYEQLRQEVQEALVEITKLRVSSPYRMSVDYDYEERKPGVEKFFIKLVTAKMDALKKQINSMDKSRYPEVNVPVLTTTIIIPTSSTLGFNTTSGTTFFRTS